MMQLVLLATFALQPQELATLEDRVDVIEVNYVHDDQLAPVYDQVIFWRWSEAWTCHEVASWRFLRSTNSTSFPGAFPIPHEGGWRCLWDDGQCWRDVRAPRLITTRTMGDRELEDRHLTPLQERRGLKVRQ